MNEIHSIMGEKHTTQILCVLDALGADWMKVEDVYMSELERGAKNIFTGQPFPLVISRQSPIQAVCVVCPGAKETKSGKHISNSRALSTTSAITKTLRTL